MGRAKEKEAMEREGEEKEKSAGKGHRKERLKRREGKKTLRGCLYQLKHSLGDFFCAFFQSTNRQFRRKTLEVLCVCVCV